MKIQQHDGVVVDAAVISGLRQASARGRGVARGEGGTKTWGAAALPPPSLSRPPRGAPTLGDWISKGGLRPRVEWPPRQVGRPPTLGFPTLGAGGGPRGAHQPTMGWFPSPLWPMWPPGAGGPTRWAPGTLPVVPVQYR